MVTQLDARFYPHIIDSIFDELVSTHPRKARLVCKAWCKRIDTDYANWLAVDTCVPGIRNQPALGSLEACLEPYSWEIVAARHPTIAYQRQSLWEDPETDYNREVQPVRDIRLEPVVLDILDPVEWVYCPISLPPADTVRFQVERYRSISLSCADMLPHVRRIIFSDGAYSDDRARVTPARGEVHALAATCTDDNCGKEHTQRIVINARTPVPRVEQGMAFLPEGLPELVVIFHGWRVVRGFDHSRLMNYHAGDPLNDIREVILAATKQGTRVTVVNEAMSDLRTGEKRTNVICVQEAILHFLNVDTENDEVHSLETLSPLVEFLTLDEYKARVGEEQFKIETMTDDNIQRLVDRRG